MIPKYVKTKKANDLVEGDIIVLEKGFIFQITHIDKKVTLTGKLFDAESLKDRKDLTNDHGILYNFDDHVIYLGHKDPNA